MPGYLLIAICDGSYYLLLGNLDRLVSCNDQPLATALVGNFGIQI